MISLDASRGLGTWLFDRGCSLLVSAYQSGLLLAIGTTDDGAVTFQTARFDRAMGLSADATGFWLATLHGLWRYAVIRSEVDRTNPHDATIVPQTYTHTGYLNAHDVAVDGSGRPLVVASQFNCLMRLSAAGGTQPLWKPGFIDALVAEDRCHLNGIAVDQGVPRLATALAASNKKSAWRSDQEGGCVIDMVSGSLLAERLFMPHSPRLLDGRTWLHQSGRGAFGYLDGSTFREVAFCPGFPRGLQVVDGVAIVGFSKPRPESPGRRLPLADRLDRLQTSAHCGILLIELKSGKAVHWIRFGERIEETYDVCVLPGVRNPALLAPGAPELRTTYLFSKPA